MTRMRPPDVHVTEHPNSVVVGRAFAEGCRGRVVRVGEKTDRPAAVYGILRGCDLVIKDSLKAGRDVYHIDHGYLGRGESFDGYYRVTKNNLQDIALEDRPDDRFRVFGRIIQPWQSGSHVVVCPIASAVAGFYGINAYEWTTGVVSELKKHTDRQVVVKPKDSEAPLSRVLQNAHCLVTFNSTAAIEALIRGIPVITLGPSATRIMGRTAVADVERPLKPEREPFLHALAYRQFTLDEMKSGLCWRLLND